MKERPLCPKDNNKYPSSEGDLSCGGTVVARRHAEVMSDGGDMSTWGWRKLFQIPQKIK